MKLFLATLCLSLVGCASTMLYRDGRPVARFEGDMTEVVFTFNKDGSIQWEAATVDHSSATIAAGKTSAGNIAAGGAAIATAGLVR